MEIKPINSDWIMFLDKETGEREVGPGDKVPGIFEVMFNLFGDFLKKSTKISPCVSLDEMKYELTVSENSPAIIIADISRPLEMRELTSLKHSYPDTHFIVTTSKSDMGDIDSPIDVFAVSALKVNNCNLFKGVDFLKTK